MLLDPVRKTVAIVHGLLGAGNGGSEARAMWAAEALKKDFDVSLVTGGLVDLAQLNGFYGTAINSREVSVCSLPIPRLLAGRRVPSALRGAFVDRALKRLAHDYDLLISAYNPCDFGVPAIQCVADFSWDEDLRRRFDPTPAGIHGLFHRKWLRSSYLGLCRMIAPSSGRYLFSGEDMIVANSRWTAAKLRARYGVEAAVIYPPVTAELSDLPHERRHNDFLCIGRISPEKRIERMIRIVGVLRSRGYDVRIRVIGQLDDSPYSRTISALAKRYFEWVLLEGRKVNTEKQRILRDCRYGIHGREGEAFGIGVAEMIKAGCITFVPAEGGPAEIVGHESMIYRDDDNAVEKITTVLDNEDLRHNLTRHIRGQAEQFSANTFMYSLRSAVDGFLGSKMPATMRRRVLCDPEDKC